ncbi:S8 family serine peptidase [Bdellovibrio bacteriovorus]|uniref:S8 family serine peptidase n=1 Tax=Bdellovibrio bacteriovorus TaxID=959 RepID=UPI0021CE96B2|nr:S8 family serine peptidase [Bdellovibrio bacteriovorus]UXR63181.1 S8 family serine peptidase [Bdellovibrio bacteriovorus]
MRYLLLILLSFSVTQQALAADPFSIMQWGLNNQGVPQMIDLDPLHTYKIPARAQEDVRLPMPVKAKKKVIVAVLDTGIQKTHPDLKNVIHRNESECRALAKFEACVKDSDRVTCEKKWMDLNNPEVDQDKNGYPLDCQGWSLLGGVNAAGIMGRPDFGDDQGHGTHVAGIVAAEVDNNIGVRGLSENVSILPVQVIGVQPSEPMKPLSIYDSPLEEGRTHIKESLGDMVGRGVIYAMRSGAQVINFSMGWPQAADSDFMRKVILEAQARGVIIVAAAGNDSTRALLRPCAYQNVICVGASGPDGAFAHFSNFGSGVDIVAPGVNILSTYPESKRPVRFRSTLGYEFLSGTSQASPYVAAAVAELLARGVPAKDVYARLVLGARPVKANLSLVEGGSHQNGQTLSPEREIYRKFAVAGNMDVERSLKVTAQPLIIPADKEKTEILWDRKSKDLSYEVSFVNKWQDVEIGKVKMNAQFLKPHVDAARPWITAVKEAAPYPGVWKQDEVRKYVVMMTINDHSDPSKSRIPSELDLTVDVSVSGQEARRYVLESEIIVPINSDSVGEDVNTFKLSGMPRTRTSFLPIDENLDNHPEERHYFVQAGDEKNWQLWVAANNGSDTYTVVGGTKIRMEAEEKLRAQILVRLDLNNDGQSEYALGVFEDRSEATEPGPSPMSFFFFDKSMKLLDSFKYSSEVAQIPFAMYWQKVGGTKRPAWVGAGKDPAKKRSLKDRWENPDNIERSQTRFYYINEKNELKSLEEHNGYKIIDVIEPRREQVVAGRVPVLLAKNQGTEAKPSYLYNFAIAEVIDGRVENFMELDLFANQNTYRNILDTRVDKVHSLDYQKDEFAGSFWFSEGLDRQQRLSVFDNKNWELLDQQLKAERSQFDSALWVRAVYSGLQRKGAFVLTNSEIQYHDLNTQRVISRSYERYTFFPDLFMSNSYYPLTLRDARDATTKIPALFTTEGSGLSRGVRMLVPVFARDGSAVELVSPARLRLKSGTGCRPLETPVFDGAKGAHSFDYYCGDKLLRVNLTY